MEWTQQGKKVILVRRETVPDDIHGMFVSQGILTATGGMTSHAAVVGRQMGKPSIVGAGALEIDETRRQFSVGGHTVKEGDYISFDGLSGEVKIARVASKPSEILQVLEGSLDAKKSAIYQRFERLLSWADKYRRMGIRANADQPDQAEIAYAFGARGIGLCRTEHMFFGEGRIPIVQKMILADNEADRRAALDELLPLQREDFYGVFKAMRGHRGHDSDDRSAAARVPAQARRAHGGRRPARNGRGRPDASSTRSASCCIASSSSTSSTRCSVIAACASASRIPEITEMQTRAIIEAACRLHKEGLKVVPEIMIPLVGLVKELRDQKAVVDRVAAEVMKEQGVKIKYSSAR